MTDKTWWILIIITVFLVGAYIIYNGNKSEKIFSQENEIADVDESKSSISTIDAEVHKIADENRALVINLENLRYSYQIQDALVKTSQRVAFSGAIDDIYRVDSGLAFTVAPSIFWEYWLSPSVRYELNGCTNQLLELVSKARSSSVSGKFAIVAEVKDVHKVALKIGGSTLSEDEVELTYETGNTFIASGNCIDIRYIEGTKREI